jgi:HK97 family phage prohead protease
MTDTPVIEPEDDGPEEVETEESPSDALRVLVADVSSYLASVQAAQMELSACLDNAAEAMEGEENEAEELEIDEEGSGQPDVSPVPRSGALRVEKRDGSTVQLRSASGALRTVKIPEAREMVAPISLDENEESGKAAPVFRGHAAVFDVESEDLGGFTESISRGAFKRALQAGQDTVALFNHNQDYVLGRTTNGTLSLAEDPRGLAAQFEAPDTQYARDIRELVRRQDVNQMSFAFTVARDDWQERADGSIHRRVLEVDRLYDVSLVTTPAYPQTSASSVRSDLPENSEETLEPPVEGAASADTSDRDPREARLNELQAGAKRRVSVARFRTNQKKEKN